MCILRIIGLDKGIIGLLLLVGILATPLAAQSLQQVVRGDVVNPESGKRLEQVIVRLENDQSQYSAETNETGTFRLEEVRVGRYRVSARKRGYAPFYASDILVQSGKELVLKIEMGTTSFDLDSVEISASNRAVQAVSTRVFTVEETKRFAAVYFDPARLASAFPGVVQANDQANHLIVRGNSPNGVQWRMEDVEIVNPNHLSNAGTFTDRLTQSGGGTIILSTQMLADSRFSTGAFGAPYGNALSGVFDMFLRPGNNDHFEFTGQAGLIGIDLSAEGPLSKAQGSSFLVNYRYSTVGLLTKGLGVDFGGEEISFQDLAFNIELPTEKAGTFSIWGMGGLSSNIFTGPREDSLIEEPKDRFDIAFRSRMGAVGVTHQLSIGDRSMWRTSVAFSGIDSDRSGELIDMQGIGTEEVEYDGLLQSRLSLHTSLASQLNSRTSLTAGTYVSRRYTQAESRFTPLGGGEETQLTFTDGADVLIQPYAQIRVQAAAGLDIQAGLHSMIFTLNESRTLEPRLSIGWQAAPRHSLRLAYGLHSQVQLPTVYHTRFTRADGSNFTPNRDLGLTQAHHLVLNYSFLPAPDWQVRLEPYYQRLFNVPVSLTPGSTFSTLNLLEATVSDSLSNEGTGENLGVDLAIEKFLSHNYYLLLAGTVYQSRYTALDGVERDTRFNGRYAMSLSGGKEFLRQTRKKTQKAIGVNLRVVYQGGFRTMPIDLDASRLAQRTVFDLSQGFTEQNNAYFRTDLRLVFRHDRPKYTRTFSFDLQNLTNTRNVAFQTYDPILDEIVPRLQLGLIPLISYRIEF